MKILLAPQAKRDAAGAYRWYVSMNPSAAAIFADAVESAFLRMLEHPNSGTPYLSDTRRMRVAGFPYWVVYRVRPRSLLVQALIHERRRPGYWIAGHG